MNILQKVKLGYVGKIEGCKDIKAALTIMDTSTAKEADNVDLTATHEQIRYNGYTYYAYPDGRIYKQLPLVEDDSIFKWKPIFNGKRYDHSLYRYQCFVSTGLLRFGCTAYPESGDVNISVYYNRTWRTGQIDRIRIQGNGDNAEILRVIREYADNFAQTAARCTGDNITAA